jgi:TonB family protein
MREGQSSVLEPETETVPDLRLLIPTESGTRIFLRNLGDLFCLGRATPLELKSTPAPFWPDVFVERPLPWLRFFESTVFHVTAIALIWGATRFLALQPHPTPQPAFTHADVVFYSPSEYLPPLDTRRDEPRPAQKPDPEYSPQPIISVPREADNRSQTIVAPPSVKLKNEVALPNTVAWSASGNPQMPIGPAPVIQAAEITRLAPQMERSVIAPPPDMQTPSQKQTMMGSPQAAVIAPPPALDSFPPRRMGDINIAHSAVIAPAPQLTVEAQRAFPGDRSPSQKARAPQVIAPPPALGAGGRSRTGGDLIALSLHPAVGAPPTPPAGNRRGNFAATPEGRRGATSAPVSSANSSAANGDGSGSGKKDSGKLPAGLYVGKTSNPAAQVAGDPAANHPVANTVNPNLLANARPPRLSSARPAQPEADSKLSEAERAVFGSRKIYSLSLNMPNLNSAGGSWIVRFAALKPDMTPAAAAAASGDRSSNTPASNSPAADLSSPTATRKVDPAYPLELMRQNVSGTVILYGLIRADGTVSNVRVLRSVDDRLDRYASEAIAKWQFQPATKNGDPVAVEATFSIPFHPTRAGSAY